MTIALRDRPDGQVEIVLYRPEVVGVMNDRDMAARFVAFLEQDDPDLIVEEPSGFATASADVAEAEDLNLGDLVERGLPQDRTALPAVIEAPRPPVFVAAPKELTEAEIEAAFERILGGEKLTAVATSIGITMGRLRGMWAAHLKQLQRHMAEGGQQACTLCQKLFTPSVSSPDKCARCSHG